MSHRMDAIPKAERSHVLQLVSELGNDNGLRRKYARLELQHVGKSATPYLIRMLDSPQENARWEAAKAMGQIADPSAASALVHSLMDPSFEVQWLAAEALIAIGQDSIKPILKGLIQNYGSIYMRQGAHHVLYDLNRQNLLSPLTQRVLEELRRLTPIEPYPLSARRALEAIVQSDHQTQRESQK